MSLPSKALATAATALAGNELRRLLGSLELDDVLQPMGLARRRTHLGESLLFLTAGIVIGGAAAVVFASLKQQDVIAWLSKAARESDEAAVAQNERASAAKTETPGAARAPEGDNHQPGPTDAIL